MTRLKLLGCAIVIASLSAVASSPTVAAATQEALSNDNKVIVISAGSPDEVKLDNIPLVLYDDEPAVGDIDRLAIDIGDMAVYIGGNDLARHEAEEIGGVSVLYGKNDDISIDGDGRVLMAVTGLGPDYYSLLTLAAMYNMVDLTTSAGHCFGAGGDAPNRYRGFQVVSTTI